MYVCSCRGVTDRTVCAAVVAGARTVDDLADRCGAGARCGGCWPELERLLAEQRDRDAHRDTRVAV
jgi:bacterioferritin-associated ferredoxin